MCCCIGGATEPKRGPEKGRAAAGAHGRYVLGMAETEADHTIAFRAFDSTATLASRCAALAFSMPAIIFV